MSDPTDDRLRAIQLARLFIELGASYVEDPVGPLEAFHGQSAHDTWYGLARAFQCHNDPGRGPFAYLESYAPLGELLGSFVADPLNDELSVDVCLVIFGFILDDANVALLTRGKFPNDSGGAQHGRGTIDAFEGLTMKELLEALESGFGFLAPMRRPIPSKMQTALTTLKRRTAVGQPEMPTMPAKMAFLRHMVGWRSGLFARVVAALEERGEFAPASTVLYGAVYTDVMAVITAL